jgi:hypothetical protein
MGRSSGVAGVQELQNETSYSQRIKARTSLIPFCELRYPPFLNS